MNTRIGDVDVTGLKMSLRVSNTSKEIVNLMRYALISCVEVPSVTEINIHVNTSYLTDDIIAHRIGLLNLDLNIGEAPKMSLKAFCECDELMVTSGMLQCEDVAVSHKDELIVVLHRGEKLEFEAVVSKGFGSQHSRFTPVCVVFFKPDPEIRVNMRKKKMVPREIIDKVYNSCPRGVFTPEIEIENASNCIFCGQCEQVGPIWYPLLLQRKITPFVSKALVWPSQITF